jgi:hypothetical protein
VITSSRLTIDLIAKLHDSPALRGRPSDNSLEEETVVMEHPREALLNKGEEQR